MVLCLALGVMASTTSLHAGMPAPNTLSEAEKLAGWKLLFDGESLDAWRNYKQDNVSPGWKIEEGAITRAAAGAGDIISKEKYENFELLLEYKISPGGNSGVMFHVTEENNTPWQSGPEIQIQDNVDGRDPQKAGWLYQLYQPGKARWKEQQSGTARADANGILDATRPAGEWNQLYIRIAKQQSAVIMNGYPYYQFVIGSDDWNKRVAESKFAAFPNFGKAGTGHICLQDHGDLVSYRNIKVREIAPDGSAKNPVHGQAKAKPVRAFPNLKLTGWDPVDETGKVREFRPVVITNAGDGSNRLFIASQRGVVHVIENKPDVTESKIFMDIDERVSEYTHPGANEEGFLALAFHPKFKENGRFFVYYTLEEPAQTSVISEFRVSKDDPNKADLESEIELMRVDQPYANHNGGSMEFGKDGHLYIGLGDGGAAYDPHGHGQNTETLLGSILRIDVDNKAEGKNYGIPADNPFVNGPGADEIFAYGLRNPWRIHFDRQTGNLWAADVGQDLWEEINLIEKGGNYGWNGYEGLHPFGNTKTEGSAPIPPVWEYDHQVGKSITGGMVYRGPGVPALKGHYLYADYVTGLLWALEVDEKTGAAKRNLEIPSEKLAVVAYGEDEAGEVYFGVGTALGQGIYRFEPVSE